MGGSKCAYYKCISQRTEKDLSFFKLPADEEKRKQWLEIMDRKDLLEKPDMNPRSYVICSKHFEESSIIFTPKLKPDAMPKRDTSPDTSNQELQIDLTFEKETKAEDVKNKREEKPGDKLETAQTAMDLSAKIPKKRKLSVNPYEPSTKKANEEHKI